MVIDRDGHDRELEEEFEIWTGEKELRFELDGGAVEAEEIIDKIWLVVHLLE